VYIFLEGIDKSKSLVSLAYKYNTISEKMSLTFISNLFKVEAVLSVHLAMCVPGSSAVAQQSSHELAQFTWECSKGGI